MSIIDSKIDKKVETGKKVTKAQTRMNKGVARSCGKIENALWLVQVPSPRPKFRLAKPLVERFRDFHNSEKMVLSIICPLFLIMVTFHYLFYLLKQLGSPSSPVPGFFFFEKSSTDAMASLARALASWKE